MPNVKSTKLLQKRSDQAVESFHKYYAAIWTEERWHGSLFPALCQPTRYCALLNRYGKYEEALRDMRRESDPSDDFENFRLPRIENLSETESDTVLPMVVQKPSGTTFPPPSRIEMQEPGTGTVLSHWNMDGASILAACMLQVRPGEKVLDLCAAPGGKSLVLAQMLWPSLRKGTMSEAKTSVEDVISYLQSNEFDQTRNKRLLTNLQSYLPTDRFNSRAIEITCMDGTLRSAANELTLGEGGYDKVLVDAPCSSERHIIHAHLKAVSSGQIAEEMANWKQSHSKTLAKTQQALLMTALRAVKIGGTVVYATCSISNEENDEVVERAMEAVKKDRRRNPESPTYAWKVKLNTSLEQDRDVKSLLDSLTEKTKYGRIAVPDHEKGGKWGPLYFCTLQKVAYHNKIIGDSGK